MGREGDGGLMLVFVGAVLAITLAVVAVAAVGQWWALAVAIAVDVAITAGVTTMLYWLLADDGDDRR